MKYRFLIPPLISIVLFSLLGSPVLAADHTPSERSHLAAPRHTVYSFADANPVLVPNDGSTGSTTIAVSGVVGNVIDVNITLYGISVTPNPINEADFLLVGPGGQKIILMSFVCGNNGPIDVTLDMSAAAGLPVPAATVCASGTYLPTDNSAAAGGYVLGAPAPAPPYSLDLATLNGVNPNGTWTLYSADFFGGDNATLTGGWSITITDDAVASTALGATAVCNGDNLDVTISTGDGPFNIIGTGAGLPQLGVSAGVYSLTGPGSWTGVTVDETTGNLETVVLGDFTCAGAPVSVPGIPVPNLGVVMIDQSRAQAAYQEPGGDPVAGIVLPADADGSGFDTYIVTNIVYVGGEYWVGLFVGSADWVYVPLDQVLPLTDLDLPAASDGSDDGGTGRN